MKNAINPYPIWLRIWHWSNALLFLTLIVTGFQMHCYSPTFRLIDFNTSAMVHNAAGILLVAFYLLFIFGSLFLGNFRFYLVKREDIWPGSYRQVIHYIKGIFWGEPAPYPHDENRKFNPIQKLSYIAVVLFLFPAIIITGLLLLFPESTPAEVMGVPGRALVALAHTCVAYIFILFTAVHVYLGTTGHTLGEYYLYMLLGDDKVGSKE